MSPSPTVDEEESSAKVKETDLQEAESVTQEEEAREPTVPKPEQHRKLRVIPHFKSPTSDVLGETPRRICPLPSRDS